MENQLDIQNFMIVYTELEAIQDKLKDWFDEHPNDDITLIVPNPNRKRELKINFIPPVTDSIENPE